MIDFSKAPEGATHYTIVGDKKYISWLRFNIGKWSYYFDSMDSWIDTEGVLDRDVDKIPEKLTVTCDNERQKMLCEQVIRMDRGEASQFTVNGHDWYDSDNKTVCLDSKYRVKQDVDAEAKLRFSQVCEKPWGDMSHEIQQFWRDICN